MKDIIAKPENTPYRKFEKDIEKMTVNRQTNYGYRGTTPNFYLGPEMEKKLNEFENY